MTSAPMNYVQAVENSPPKIQQPAGKCECCQSTQHSILNCNKLGNMRLEDKMTELKGFQYCFRCMHKGHIAKFCKNKPIKCGKCNLMGHPTILHGIRELRQQQYQQRLAAQATSGNQPSTSNPTPTLPNINPASNQPSTSQDQGATAGNTQRDASSR